MYLRLQLALSLELLLLLLIDKRINLLIIEIFKVLFRNLAQLLTSLEQQVIRGGDMVMLVCIDALDSIVLLKVVFNQ